MSVLDIDAKDLAPDARRGNSTQRRVTIYSYLNERGVEVYQKVRYDPKGFKLRRRDPSAADGWYWRLDGTRRVLFNLPEVTAAIDRRAEIELCEGEKDCLNVGGLGFTATTWPGGATKGNMSRKWPRHFTQILAKATRVVGFPHNDAAGLHSIEYIAGELVKADCPDVRVVLLPDLGPSEDVSDFIARGGTANDLRALIDATPMWKPRVETAPIVAGTLDEIKSRVLSELASAHRLKKCHGENLRHHSALGFLVWDGKRWARSHKAAVRMAQSIGAIVRKELTALGAVSPETAKAFYAHAKDIERHAGVANLLQHARALQGIDADNLEFDAQPWLLNCPNGTLDLQTSELRPHRREDYLTSLCPTPYDPKATTARWEQFLREVFSNDMELIEYLQWTTGLSLSGCTTHDAFYVLHGTGANGKSTFLNTILRVLGPDYAQQLDPETLLIQRFVKHSTDLAMLRGVRLAVAIETGEGRHLNEPLIKALCGGDRLRARFVFHDSFEFQPTLKLWIATNHAPTIKDDSTAMWRRIRFVPFARQFLGSDADPNMEDALLAEAPGILAWAVHGIVGRYEQEPRVPSAVRAATEEYRQEQDVLSDFVRSECQSGPYHTVSIKRLYAAYTAFTSGHCESKRAFCARLRSMGYAEGRTPQERVFLGISLIENDLLHGHDSA